MNEMQARQWEHYCSRSDKIIGCVGEGNKIGIREKNSMMLFHDGDCYPKGEVSPQQLRFEYVAELHNSFPAIAQALLTAVEALENIPTYESDGQGTDFCLGCNEPFENHAPICWVESLEKALYRINSLTPQ